MENITEKFEEFWKKSPIVAWVLTVAGVSAAVWSIIHPQPSGISIGLLAAAAGIMSVRPEMHFYEKMVWVVLLVSFTVLEVQAIKKNDRAYLKASQKQNEQFTAIVTTLDTQSKATAKSLIDAYALSQGQFNATMKENQSILSETRRAAAAAEEGVNNLTGGKGFAFTSLLTLDDKHPQFSLVNKNRYPLRDLTITITDLTELSKITGKRKMYDIAATFPAMRTIQIADVKPTVPKLWVLALGYRRLVKAVFFRSLSLPQTDFGLN